MKCGSKKQNKKEDESDCSSLSPPPDYPDYIERGSFINGRFGSRAKEYVEGSSPWTLAGARPDQVDVTIRFPNKRTKEEEEEDEKDDEDAMTWQDVAKTLDWLCFITFSLFIVVSSCLTLMAMIQGRFTCYTSEVLNPRMLMYILVSSFCK